MYALYCTVHISTLPWLLIQCDPFDIPMAAVVLFCGGISKLAYVVLELITETGNDVTYLNLP